MRLALAIVMAASVVSSALAADLSATDVRALLAFAGVNPGTSREVNGEGKRRGDFVIRVHIDGGPSRQAGP